MSLQNKQRKIDEKDKEYSANDSSIYMHKWIVTFKQKEKLKEYKQGCSGSRDQDLETTRSSTYKKKEKAKQVRASATQGKENCEILALEKGELLDLKDKEDLKMIQELYETDLNIQLGTIDEDINKEDLTKWCKEWAKILIVLEQLLDISSSELLTWGQLRKCKLSKATGRKPIWFEKIEQKVLEGSISRKIKAEWQQNMTNTLAPRVELLKISIDKRKKEWVVFKTKRTTEFGKIVGKSDKSWIEIEHWCTEINDLEHTTKLKKCKDCQMNEDLDTAAEHCIFQKQLRSKKRAFQNNWLKKAEEANEFWLEVPLESIMGKKHRMQSTVDTLHIDNLQMLTIKIATREEELINMHLEELQAAEKLKSLAGQIREYKE
ncbi:1160_t:CDS:2, partial [Gigaspora margarita]